MSIVILLWLAVCAALDWRERRVPNALTLPPLLLALGLRLFGLAHGEGRAVLVVSAVLMAGWFAGGLGGADVKVSLALGLYSPLLAVWAWGGALALLSGARLVERFVVSRKVTLPGFLGFFVGVLAGVLWTS